MTLLNFPPTNGQPTDGSFTYVANGVIYAWDGEKWTANTEQSFEDTYVNIDGDTMTGDLTVPSLNGGPLAGMRNQLINGDMKVWQRGTSGGTNVYTADRWRASAGVTTWTRAPFAATAPGFEFGLRFSGAANCYVAQGIELLRAGHPNQFTNGSTWTLSFYASHSDIAANVYFSDAAEPLNGPNLLANTAPTSLGGNRYSVSFTISTAPNASNICVGVRIINTTGAQLEIGGCQLEPGPVATPFEHRPISAELALCQRYYQRHDIVNRLVVSGTGVLQAYNYTFSFPQAMRAASTVTREGNSARTGAAGFASVTTDKTTAYLQATSTNTNTLQGAGDYSFDAEL